MEYIYKWDIRLIKSKYDVQLSSGWTVSLQNILHLSSIADYKFIFFFNYNEFPLKLIDEWRWEAFAETEVKTAFYCFEHECNHETFGLT